MCPDNIDCNCLRVRLYLVGDRDITPNIREDSYGISYPKQHCFH